MEVRYRPISNWPGERTPAHLRASRWTFKAGWTDTLQILERELEKLDARNVVIEVDLRENQIRLDGWPKSGAYPSDPGVVLSFDSKFGPLRYATDVFQTYEHNVRAIALGLEALRKVDRYGITRRGEQYTGWKQLGAGIALGPAGFDSAEKAAAFIADAAELPLDAGTHAIHKILTDSDYATGAYRLAAKKLHPDAGGDTADFQRLQAAWAMLEVAS